MPSWHLGWCRRQVSCPLRDPYLCCGARQHHAAARGMGHQALPPRHPGTHSLPQAHVENGSLQLHSPERHQRMVRCVFYGDQQLKASHISHRENHTALALRPEAGHHQGCPVPDLGTAKAQWLKVSQSSSRLPSGLGHSLEGAACCGQGLEQRQEGTSAPPIHELQVFSLEFSMG